VAGHGAGGLRGGARWLGTAATVAAVEDGEEKNEEGQLGSEGAALERLAAHDGKEEDGEGQQPLLRQFSGHWRLSDWR